MVTDFFRKLIPENQLNKTTEEGLENPERPQEITDLEKNLEEELNSCRNLQAEQRIGRCFLKGDLFVSIDEIRKTSC